MSSDKSHKGPVELELDEHEVDGEDVSSSSSPMSDNEDNDDPFETVESSMDDVDDDLA